MQPLFRNAPVFCKGCCHEINDLSHSVLVSDVKHITGKIELSTRSACVHAVITGTTFDETNLDGASFEDALIGNEDVKRMCVARLWC